MLISESLISLNLQARDKQNAIEQLASLAQEQGKIVDYTGYVQDVLLREQEYTTGFGGGIAIPHAKSAAVKEAMIVLGRFNKGVEWQANDGNLVDIVFLLGVPAENIDNIHLKIISQLARKLANEDFVQFLKNAHDKGEILRCLNEIGVA